MSLVLTNAVVGTYLCLRYFTLVRDEGARAGSVEWAREVQRRVKREVTVKKEEKEEQKTARPDQMYESELVESDRAEEQSEDGTKSDGSGVPDDVTVVIGEGSPEGEFKVLAMDSGDSPVFVKSEPAMVSGMTAPTVDVL